MLTVLVTPEYWKLGCDPRMFFDINGDPYRFVENDNEGPVDILLTYSWSRSKETKELIQRYDHKISLELDLWHGFDNMIPFLDNVGYSDRRYVLTVSTYDPTVNNPNIIGYDFSFNRLKAYYSQFPFSPGWIPYYWSGQQGYIAPRLPQAATKQKIFLAPCNTQTARSDHPCLARFAIAKLVRDKHQNNGYLGNITDEYPNDYLQMHSAYSLDNDLESIHSRIVPPSHEAYGLPPHNLYYNNTFISIYAETMESGTTLPITEKTYDPLIKGHFVLPFAAAGFVARLKDVGIVLPTFIDYSYDQIQDFDQRLACYLVEADRLLSLSIDDWRLLYQQNLLSVLHANQLYFHNRPYDKVNLQELILKHYIW